MTKIKLGCDPEIFIRNKKTGNVISAAGLFPGTKQEPYKIEKGAIQVDGTALEFNIDPASSEDEFYKNISLVTNQMQDMVKGVDKDFEIFVTPVAKFSLDDWKKINPEAKVLGCDPDYDYQGNINPNPGDRLLNEPVRTGSGHVHLGWTEGEDPSDRAHFEDCKFIANGMFNNGFDGVDRTLPSKERYLEQERLVYYGFRGSFRPKSYGIELRAPSNFWIRTENSIRNMYRKVNNTFERITS